MSNFISKKKLQQSSKKAIVQVERGHNILMPNLKKKITFSVISATDSKIICYICNR